MDLKEYTERIMTTGSDDWTILPCWGFGAGPSYLESPLASGTGERSLAFEAGSSYGAGPSYSESRLARVPRDYSGIEIESHTMRASLKSDLFIWIAWGYPSNPDFREPWANQFPDPQARSYIIDFFYNQVLVFRDIYVDVDGGRCYLPLPEREFDSETNEIRRYTVARDKYTFFKMFDGFERLSDFDQYFNQAKFDIVDASWII